MGPDMADRRTHPRNGTIRPATLNDAQAIFDIRRAAILAFAAPAMPPAQAREWADAHPPVWTVHLIRERQVWTYDLDGDVVAWVSAAGNRVDGLYTSPPHAGQGIASALLQFVEANLIRLGHTAVLLDASANAERFYRRRGYEAAGLRPLDGTNYGALPMRKVLV